MNTNKAGHDRWLECIENSTILVLVTLENLKYKEIVPSLTRLVVVNAWILWSLAIIIVDATVQ